MEKRNKTLDVYKGLLIICVVFRHTLQYSVFDEGGILTNFIWAVQMPGFMLAAGYFSTRVITSICDTGKRILLSVQHYALPFFSWFILIDIMLLGKYVRNPIAGAGYLLNHVDGGLWFLWVVFMLSIVAILCNLTLSSEKMRYIKLLSVAAIYFALLLVVGVVCGVNFLGIKYILCYAVFYGFGWFAKWTKGWWKQWWDGISGIVRFICLAVFLSIVFHFDLYRSSDNILSIFLRFIAGITGNLVLLGVCQKYENVLKKGKMDWLGMYTLEIYATHMCVNNLMMTENRRGFFTISGFQNFSISLVLTITFTIIIIAAFKSIPIADLIFYGKMKREKFIENDNEDAKSINLTKLYGDSRYGG